MGRPLDSRQAAVERPEKPRIITLGVIVQAHPSRLGAARRLARNHNARVILDPDPSATPSPWRSYAACLQAASPYEWTVIIQDDSEPHPQLIDVCRRIVQAHPKRLVCLYHGRIPRNNAVRMSLARDRGLCYAEMRAGRYIPSVALLWPPHLIQRVKLWAPARSVPADDEMISRFLTERGHYDDRYLATVPSLVDHPDTQPSLMGTSNREPRTAVLPPPTNLAECNWESGVLTYL